MNMSHHTKLGRHVCVLNDEIVRVIGMLLSLFAGRLSSRIGMKRLITIALTTCIVSIILMGVTTNIILITTFSVLFVAGIAFAIPTVISKVGVVVKTIKVSFYLLIHLYYS